MDGVLADFRLKRPHLSEIGQAVRLRFVNAQLRAISVRGGIQHFRLIEPTWGLTSRDIIAHPSAARPSFGGTQLRSAYAGAERGARRGGRRPRSPCFGP